MPVGGCIKVTYTGGSASCLLISDSTGKTLSSWIGAFGAEVLDPAFGLIDLTLAANDTLDDLVAVIDALANYSAEIVYGDDIPTENIVDAMTQAKVQPGYVLFNLPVSVLSPYALTTWARYKALRGSALAPDSDQTQVEYLINAVTDAAEQIAGGRKLVVRAYGVGLSTPYDFDGNDSDTLVLPHFPINSVTHLYIDDTRVFAAATEIDTDDYTWDPDKGVLYYPHNIFPAGRRNIRLVWNAGWATVPDRVQLAAIETVAWNLSRLRGTSIGMRTVSSPDGVASSYELEIPTSARRVFESLRGRDL